MPTIAVKAIIGIIGFLAAILATPKAFGQERFSQVLIPMQQLPQKLLSAKENVGIVFLLLNAVWLDFVFYSWYYHGPGPQWLRYLLNWEYPFLNTPWWTDIVIGVTAVYLIVNAVIPLFLPNPVKLFREMKYKPRRVKVAWGLIYSIVAIEALPLMLVIALFILYLAIVGLVVFMLPIVTAYGIVYCLVKFLEWLCIKNYETQCARLSLVLLVTFIILTIVLL